MVIGNESGTVKSVLKALAALDYIMEQSMTSSGVGLSDIAAALEIQPTTARNILKTMERAGYVSRAGNRLYVPGPKCHGMTRAARVSERLLEIMTPVLNDLAAQLGESLVVTTLFNGMRKVLMRQQGTAQIVVETGSAEQDHLAYRLVTTRIMLAFARTKEVDLFVRLNGLPGPEWGRIANRDALDSKLMELRKAGYCAEKGGDIFAAAFPILDRDGMMLGAIGIYLPLFRCDTKTQKKIFRVLQDTLKHVQGNL